MKGIDNYSRRGTRTISAGAHGGAFPRGGWITRILSRLANLSGPCRKFVRGHARRQGGGTKPRRHGVPPGLHEGLLESKTASLENPWWDVVASWLSSPAVAMTSHASTPGTTKTLSRESDGGSD